MRRTTPIVMLGLAALVAILAVAATAAGQEECDAEVVEHGFVVDGQAVAAADIRPGDEVTAHATVEGCGELRLSLVSLNATDDAAFDADTGVFGAGEHTLTVHVPMCTFRLDLMAEAMADAEAEAETQGGSLSGTLGAAAELILSLDGGDACAHDAEGASGDDTGSGNGTGPAPENETATETETEVDADVEADVDADVDANVTATADAGIEALVCPDLRATANGDGSVSLHVDAEAGVGTLLLYRQEGNEDMQLVTMLEGDTYLDTDTEAGISYTYEVRPILGGLEDCMVEVTSVPVFPGAFGMLAAVGLASVGYITLRWRS